MAASTKLFLLCALLNLSLSPSGSHHREHKVHNIVLYPDKHSWCKTLAIKQVINYPGCESFEISNNVCVGACFSYSIPRTEPSDPGEVIVPYCDSCQPSTTTWHQITLQCDDNKFDNPPLLVKRVQIIHNCSCTLCDERFKIGNKVTYDVINSDKDAEPDDESNVNVKDASDLMLLQNRHAVQVYSGDIDDSAASNSSHSLELIASPEASSSDLATDMMRSKRMQRVLNQKIIELLVDIEQHNRPDDKEQLLDLLRVTEHDLVDGSSGSSKSLKQQLAEIKHSLRDEENLSPSNAQRIRDLLQEINNFKLQRSCTNCDSHRSTDILAADTSNDDDFSFNDDNVQQFVGNDLESIAQQTIVDAGWQEDEQKNKNEDASTDEAVTTAADYMLPIWLREVNTADDRKIGITDIVEQREHEQHQRAIPAKQRQPHHQKEHKNHHQLAQHHKQREHDGANAARKRRRHQQQNRQQQHYHNHHHIHHHHGELQQQDDDMPPTVLPQHLATPEFPTNNALLLHRQHHIQPREKFNVKAHELKPNHAGTLLSYHTHVVQRDEEATVLRDDVD